MSLFIPSAFVNNAEENDIVECSVKRYYDDAYDYYEDYYDYI